MQHLFHEKIFFWILSEKNLLQFSLSIFCKHPPIKLGAASEYD
ncbi:hypothetical protein wcw_1436 [Waddlia chondrophila WSU 86-1044]|uniref:Uncharacterized protein n=1 Tax=Waddlia chondrophila (strain ATCC VR-1470 / WSU 86-1044) TaxID=716544 RepID=D6YRU0_WADCW|nr:hypothetical protein wcw_1436 [Waddlia chondrophila WSU 86-1044]